MILWISKITGLSPLLAKVILSAAAIGAIFLCLRWYGNRQYYAGETQGRRYMAAEMEKQKRAEWKQKEDAIARAAADIATEKRAVEAAADQLSSDRANLSRTLKDTLAKIQQERTRQYEDAAAVPDAQLWDAIRAVSAELATAKP